MDTEKKVLPDRSEKRLCDPVTPSKLLRSLNFAKFEKLSYLKSVIYALMRNLALIELCNHNFLVGKH